jgi:hypothetical protein
MGIRSFMQLIFYKTGTKVNATLSAHAYFIHIFNKEDILTL